MYSLNYLRDDLEMEELKKLRQEYHDNPCLETRFCSSLHSNFLRKR